jgi:hypothetical protein
MRHQCDIKATPKPVDSQPIETPEPPRCDPKATLKPFPSHTKARSDSLRPSKIESNLASIFTRQKLLPIPEPSRCF